MERLSFPFEVQTSLEKVCLKLSGAGREFHGIAPDQNWFMAVGQKLTIWNCQPRLASLVAQTAKNLPAMWETQVQSLGWEDPLEKGMAIHSSILAWRIPWTEEPGGLYSMGSQRVGHD